MGDKEVFRDDLYDQLEEGLSYSGGDIQIEDSSAVLVHDRSFCPVVTELVNNCLDKDAERVKVSVEWGRIIVEDDVIHTQDELEVILVNVTSERPRTTKEPDPELGYSLGGVGIVSVRSDLARHGGLLSYETTEEGRIRAVATWPVANEAIVMSAFS